MNFKNWRVTAIVLLALVGQLALAQRQKSHSVEPTKTFAELSVELRDAKSLEQAQALADEAGLLQEERNSVQAGSEDDTLEQFRTRVGLLARLEGHVDTSTKQVDPSAEVSAIKKSPLYRGVAEQREGNWLQKALERFRFQPPKNNLRAPTGFSAALTTIVWVLLGLIAATLLGLAIYFFSTRIKRRRKDAALLDSEEPLRSSDEWVSIGRQAESLGDLRSAVRAYYLAALLRLDEAQVLQFQRTETNWQHLRRLNSVKDGANYGLNEPTRWFDRIWFGGQTAPAERVVEFRGLADLMTKISKEQGVL